MPVRTVKPSYLWILFGLELGLGLGCGQTPSVHSVQSVREDPTPLQINAAKNGNLYCDFTDECEPAVAMVSVATGKGVSRCSAFLISDHEILTNDHCLNTIADRQDACQGLAFIHFSDDVHRSCKRVSVRSYQKGIASQDYAVIELNAPVRDRQPLPISKRGFSNLEPATIFSVQVSKNPQTGSYDGRQVKLNCQASYSTLMNINITSSAEPIMTFGDCAIQEGNSGSPILNKNGEVGAIVQGYLTVKGDAFSEILQAYLLDGSYGEVAIATQTSCMQELVGNAANSCNAVKPISALYPKQYLEGFGGFSEKFLPKITRGFSWKEARMANSSEKTFFSALTCISSSDLRSPNFSFISNVISYRQGINSRLQAEWRALNQIGEKQAVFTLQKTSTPKPISVDFTSAELGTLSLPVCVR